MEQRRDIFTAVTLELLFDLDRSGSNANEENTKVIFMEATNGSRSNKTLCELKVFFFSFSN